MRICNWFSNILVQIWVYCDKNSPNGKPKTQWSEQPESPKMTHGRAPTIHRSFHIYESRLSNFGLIFGLHVQKEPHCPETSCMNSYHLWLPISVMEKNYCICNKVLDKNFKKNSVEKKLDCNFFLNFYKIISLLLVKY